MPVLKGVEVAVVSDAVGDVNGVVWPDTVGTKFGKLTCWNKNPGLADAGGVTFERIEEYSLWTFLFLIYECYCNCLGTNQFLCADKLQQQRVNERKLNIVQIGTYSACWNWQVIVWSYVYRALWPPAGLNFTCRWVLVYHLHQLPLIWLITSQKFKLWAISVKATKRLYTHLFPAALDY